VNRLVRSLGLLISIAVVSATAMARAQEPSASAPVDGKDGNPPAAEDSKNKPQTLVCAACNTLDTRISGRLTSEVYLTQRSRARILGNGFYVVDQQTVVPFYETVELRADEVYHKGLSVHFQGWTGFDLADVYFDDRFKRVVGDPTYLYVQFRDNGVDARLGRQMVFTGTARGLHMDGIDASYQFPFYLGVEALAGLVVSPYFGPNWQRGQPEVDFDSFGPGFSDWEREGDYAVGGRVFYERLGLVTGGISFLHLTESDEMAQQLIGADLAVTPLDWAAAYVNAALDLPTGSIQQIDAELDFYPFPILSFGIDYSLTDPSLFLSHMSIFSIFSSEQYHSMGGTARIRPLDWLQAFAGAHALLYDYVDSASENGIELSGGVTFRYLERRDGTVGINYRRVSETENGLHELRTRLTVPFAITGLKAVSNFYLDIYDHRVADQKLSYIGDLGLFYSTGLLTAGGTVSSGRTPYHEDEIRAMVKFAYNIEKAFVERKRL
jgi:hypothetical protein